MIFKLILHFFKNLCLHNVDILEKFLILSSHLVILDNCDMGNKCHVMRITLGEKERKSVLGEIDKERELYLQER